MSTSWDDLEDHELWALRPGDTDDLLVQRFFATHRDTTFRVMLAGNAALEPEVQLELAQDHKSVQLALVENEALTLGAQRVLSQSEHPAVRMELAEHFDLAPDVQMALTIDTHSWVRYNLASNGYLAHEVQAELLRDEDLWDMLATNAGVSMSDDFPVRFLERSGRGRALVERQLQDCGADPEGSAVLRAGWMGTLTELVETVQELAGPA